MYIYSDIIDSNITTRAQELNSKLDQAYYTCMTVCIQMGLQIVFFSLIWKDVIRQGKQITLKQQIHYKKASNIVHQHHHQTMILMPHKSV